MVTVFTSEDQTRPRHPEKVRLPDTPGLKKPDWIARRAPGPPAFDETRRVLRRHRLNTVCEEAACPNIGECWGKRHATVMILGDTCTRACAFCNVRTGRPLAVDPFEPGRVGAAIAELGLAHVVVTSVDRDDLDDGGAAQFAATIASIKRQASAATIEVLTPDFLRKDRALEVVMAARPDVFNHNLETVPSLYRRIRPGARYEHSLHVLRRAKELGNNLVTQPSSTVARPATTTARSA